MKDFLKGALLVTPIALLIVFSDKLELLSRWILHYFS